MIRKRQLENLIDQDLIDDDDEWDCAACGGPMYRQPHWSYGQCDDCGRREKLEGTEP